MKYEWERGRRGEVGMGIWGYGGVWWGEGVWWGGESGWGIGSGEEKAWVGKGAWVRECRRDKEQLQRGVPKGNKEGNM